jgi:hypothetical protein
MVWSASGKRPLLARRVLLTAIRELVQHTVMMPMQKLALLAAQAVPTACGTLQYELVQMTGDESDDCLVSEVHGVAVQAWATAFGRQIGQQMHIMVGCM